MRVVKRNRYYCDYCKKSGGAAGHMKKHESRCTLNPNRECGMCKTADQNQPDIAEIIKALPKMVEVEYEDFDGYPTGTKIQNTDKINESLEMVRDKTNNCPACIMATYRQAGIYIGVLDDFNFKKECNEFWVDFNEAQRETYGY